MDVNDTENRPFSSQTMAQSRTVMLWQQDGTSSVRMRVRRIRVMRSFPSFFVRRDRNGALLSHTSGIKGYSPSFSTDRADFMG